ncbi:MAG: hypothetical protein JWN04_1562 [Myxococcaceae bacterium]|nr:hypothetical protein [Myxococcaceae bacterium]
MDIKPKNLLKRVLQFARQELERRAAPPPEEHEPSAPSDGKAPMARSLESAPVSPALHGLEVVRPHAGGLLTLRWAVTQAEVTRAQALVTGKSVLCVRLVNFSKRRADVVREVQDRPNVELSGQCEIGEPQQRAVVSLGLRAGDRFVSIAHHVI